MNIANGAASADTADSRLFEYFVVAGGEESQLGEERAVRAFSADGTPFLFCLRPDGTSCTRVDAGGKVLADHHARLMTWWREHEDKDAGLGDERLALSEAKGPVEGLARSA